MASNAENVSIGWRHHDQKIMRSWRLKLYSKYINKAIDLIQIFIVWSEFQTDISQENFLNVTDFPFQQTDRYMIK